MGLKELLGKKADPSRVNAGEAASDPLEDPMVLSMIFHPRKDLSGPDQDQRAQDLVFQISPSLQIGARFFPTGKEFPNVIFFHGNGEIAKDYDDIARFYLERGLNLLVVDYRGYGLSTGTPTLRSMLQDAMDLMDPISEWLAKEGFRSARWIMGRSLGSCPAIHVARHRPELLSGLVVESGFADTLGLLSRIGLPNSLLLQVPKEWRGFNLEGMAQVELPTLIIHGEMDQIIPLRDGVALFQACREARKELVVIPQAGHNDLLWTGLQKYMGALEGFIKKG